MKNRLLGLIMALALTLILVLSACTSDTPGQPTTTQTITGTQTTTTTSVTTTSTTTNTTTTAAPTTPQYGGTITMVSGIDPLDFDQAYKTAWQSWSLDVTNEPLIDPLWTAGPAGTKELLLQAYPWYTQNYLTGALLEDWEYETPTKWILHVRKGVHFHNKAPVNGREMVAEDVAVSIRRMLTLPGSWLAAIANKPTITVTDKYTLVLEFEKFDISWEYRLMDTVFVVPKEAVLDSSGNETQALRDWKNSVGTGAWMMTDWVKGSSVTFSKHPNYWGHDPFYPENQLPYADKILTLVISDPSTSLAAFRTSKIDLRVVTIQDAPSVMQTSPAIKYVEMFANYSLEMNMRTELDPFNKKEVRQALSKAINREVIINDLFKGHATYINRFFNPAEVSLYVPFEDLPENLKDLFTYNQEEAKQMLTAAGYPNGFTTSVMVVSTDSTALEVAALVRSDWAKIGVTLNIDPRESAVATSIRYARTFEGLQLSGYGNAFPWTAFDIFTTGHYSNWSGVSDDWFDQAKSEVVGIADAEQRIKLATDINYYALENMWVIPLPTPTSYQMWWPWVKQWEGSYMSGTYHYYRPLRQAWVDQTLKNNLLRN